MDVTQIVAWLFGTVVFFAILFLVIRAAVRSGLRDHQEWLDARATAKDSIHTE